jgi:hypothetical protein
MFVREELASVTSAFGNVERPLRVVSCLSHEDRARVDRRARSSVTSRPTLRRSTQSPRSLAIDTWNRIQCACWSKDPSELPVATHTRYSLLTTYKAGSVA